MTEQIFPNQTQWAIAAKLPGAALEGIREQLPKGFRGAGSKVVEGADGFAALLVFGGAAEEGEPLAGRLATSRKTSVYLLDFDDEAESVKEIGGPRAKRLQIHPAEFLEERGIVAPGYEDPESPIVTVAVVEAVTPEQARKTLGDVDAVYAPHPRGTLITGDAAGMVAITLTLRLKRRAYVLDFDRSDQTFSCVISDHDSGRNKYFSPHKSNPNYEAVSSILGERTLDGILRVLEIPRALID